MNVRKFKGLLRVAGPTVCACLASAGVVVTAILSAKGALKAEEVLHNDELSAKEKLKAAVPAFAPAGVAGIATTGLIFVANILGAKQQAALVAGMASLYKSSRDYRDTVKNGNDTPDGLLTFYEPVSKRYFKRTIEEVLEAEYKLNRNFILRGYAPLNEFYEFLGIEKTPDGEKLGWSEEVGYELYGYGWVDFEHPYVGNEDGTEHDYYLIDMIFSPTADYLTYPYED